MADVKTGWRPIKTAPQREPILVWSAEDGANVAVQCDRYNWALPRVKGSRDDTIWLYYAPTHWMPLPEKPE